MICNHQDLVDLKWYLDNKLTTSHIHVLRVNQIDSQRSMWILKFLAKNIHVVNLILEDSFYELIQIISYEHLVVSDKSILYNEQARLALYQLASTLQFNRAIIPMRVFNRLLPKLKNTYSFTYNHYAIISSSNTVNVNLLVPFRAWSGSTDMTESIMIRIKAYLNVDPMGFLLIEQLDPMMCWQGDSVGMPHMTRHVGVTKKFEQIHPEIQSVRVSSIETILEFSDYISVSNMMKVSTVYLDIVPEDRILIHSVTHLYPSIKAIYRLPYKPINLLY